MKDGGFGKLRHRRAPASVDEPDVVRRGTRDDRSPRSREAIHVDAGVLQDHYAIETGKCDNLIL